jgi:Type IV secretion system pilin
MYTIQDILKGSATLIGTLIKVSVAIAVLVFFWGLVKFIFKAGDEKSHEEGRNRMIWGVIALFVLVSIWGIVKYLQSDFGLTVGPQDMGGICDGSDENPCL